jgi:cytochrome b561
VPPWQVSSARTVHIILYVLLFIIPILGWIDASWRDFQVTLFGLFSLPPLITAHAAGWGWIGDAHAILSNFGLTGAFGLHVVATLYHEFIRKDRILERMLPARWLAGSR